MFNLVLLFLFYSVLNVVIGVNVTYVVRKDNKGGFSSSCIAEELERYVGIGWIYPIPDTPQGLPTVVSRYIPAKKNDFNCKFFSNSHCNSFWLLKDWYIDHSSPRTKHFITDTRWEDLPTILITNDSDGFEEKIEVDYYFEIPFSVRADGLVEIIVCSGSNPFESPCYYLNIDYREIYFKQYHALPKDIKDDFKNAFVDNYKAYSNILSIDEWRNFALSSDPTGTVKLVDLNLNRVLIEHTVKEPIASSYMFMRSGNNSVWKFHKNSFLYTNTTQTSRLGPQLFLPNKDLCVSMLVKTCSNCQMIFFYMNSTRKMLKTVGPTRNEEWVEIKLKEENTQYEKLNIFVETKYVDTNLNVSGFWAIDEARVCNENEVKVSYLKLNNIRETENVTCQVIKNPSWRPKKLVFDDIKEFPEISVKTDINSIRLSWDSEDPSHSISYYVSYEANDICSSEPYNLRRLKSNGFVSTKSNEILLNNLVPYTVYNITVSNVFHQTDQKIYINTLETVEPSLEELPSNIQLKALDTSIQVSWENVNCSKKYGRLAYTLIVYNRTLNFSKELSFQIGNNYEISGLQPFTHYVLTILTARNGKNLYHKDHTSNFTLNFMTMPGVASPPENLEIYSMDQNTASLRYNLPSNTHGITKEIQVSRCNSLSFSKCKSTISLVKRCSLWPKKYCVDVNYLIPLQSYTFKVSLKNLNTPSFSQEAKVKGIANDRVPGKPTNITYKIVDCQGNTDYCNLNVTWLHPYYQNGTITYFDIILNSTDKRKDAEEDKYIHETYNIVNHTYYYDYTYQIKNIPYSSYYNIYLQSANTVLKSEYTEAQIKTDNIGDHIDQSPKLIAKSDTTLLFKIPHLDRRLESYNLTVVVQDYDKSRKIDYDLLNNRRIADNLCQPFGDTWISQVIKVDSNTTQNVMVGNAEKERLQPSKKYCITFIITNQYRGSEHEVVYYEKLKMLDSHIEPKETTSGSSSNHLYMLLFILLVIPFGFFLYRYLRKKHILKSSIQTNDHVYETLPCEEIARTNRINEKSPQPS